MSKIKIGIIGAGGISSAVHLPLLSCFDNVTIEYIADTRDPKILAKSYNTNPILIDKISSLPDCDIAVLAIPVGAREKYIEEFSQRNCYIFSEKPFAINLNMHKNFLELSKRITCNYMRPYYNSTRKLKDILESEIFGPIKKITINEGGIIGKTNRGKDSYQSDPTLSGGGFLLETACHTFSQLDYLFKKINVEESKTIFEDNFDIESHVKFHIEDEKTNFSCEYLGTMLRHVEPKTTITFEQNELEFNHLDPEAIFNISGSNSEKKFTINKENYFASNFAQAFYLKWTNFLDKVSDSSKIDTQTETSIQTTKIIDDVITRGRKK